MKKFTKFIYSMFAFMMITCMAMFCPAITSVDAVDLPDNSIEISTGAIDSEVTKGEQMLIPVAKVTNASADSQTIVELTDRNGQKYEYEQGKAYAGSYFTLLKADKETVATDPAEVAYIQPVKYSKGVYSVRYKVVDGSLTYYSKTTTIRVTGISYSWEFNKANTLKNIIPSVTASGATYTLPTPSIIPSEGDPIAYDVSNIEITKNGVTTTAELVIDEGVAKFTPVLEEGKTSTTYVIKYKSPNASYNLNTRSYTITVKKDYVNEVPVDKLEVTHSSISNLQVGATTTFPTANVTDKTHNVSNVEVNTIITVKKGENEVKLAPNQYEYKFETAGEYTISYEVIDAYGNKGYSKAVVKTVDDLAPYQISFAEDYDTTEQNWEDNVITGADYLVPAEVGYDGFVLPAVYGKDWNTAYGNLKFTRKLVAVENAVEGGQKEYNIDLAEDNKALTEDNTDFSKAIQFKFPEADASIHGTKKYTLTYTVEDSVGKTKSTSYTIKVVDMDAKVYNLDKGLEINLPTITEHTNNKAELTFTAANAKETIPTGSEMEADTRLQIKTFYYYGSKATLDTALTSYKASLKTTEGFEDYNEKYGYNFDLFADQFDNTNKLYSLTTKDSKVTLKLEEFNNQPMITIFAVAINDQGQFVIDAQEVIIDNISETSIPTITTLGDHDDFYSNQFEQGQTVFNQYENVTLPAIKFADEHDASLSVDVKCYVDTPDKIVDVVIEEFDINGIKNATLNTSYYGSYYVVYTATDDAGNSVSYVSTFDVAKTSLGHIEVGNGGTISKVIGEQVTFALDIVGDGVYTDKTYDIKWGDLKPAGLGSNDYSFRFDKEGTYIATISGSYKLHGKQYEKDDMPSVTVTINVTKPTITWDKDVESLITENRNADIDEVITLNTVTALENGKEIPTEIKVTFTDKNSKVSDVTLDFDAETELYSFKAEDDGVYKVTYSAISEYSSSEKSFTVTSGDYYAPEVFIEEGNSLQDTKITYTNKNITFEVVSFERERDEDNNRLTGKYILKVKATEDKDGDNAKELFTKEIKVSLKDTNVSKVTDFFNTSNYTFTLTGDSQSKKETNVWTISGVGTYELQLTVKDTNGNTSEAGKITFSVVNETEPKKPNNNNVIGIVLIAVSAVILGGVILFFALAGKRKPKRKTIKSNQVDKQ